MKRITCSIPADQAEIFSAAAARSGRSLNQFLRTALLQWAKEHRIEPPQIPAQSAPISQAARSKSGGWGWL